MEIKYQNNISSYKSKNDIYSAIHQARMRHEARL